MCSLTANQETGAIVRAVLAVTNFILWAGRNKLGKAFSGLCLFVPRGKTKDRDRDDNKKGIDR